MHRSDIAGSKIAIFSIGWCEILQEFNLVSEAFENSDRDLSARHSGDFTGQITGMMGRMRKLEAENIAPERKRTLEVRNGDAGVICGDDAKRHSYYHRRHK